MSKPYILHVWSFYVDTIEIWVFAEKQIKSSLLESVQAEGFTGMSGEPLFGVLNAVDGRRFGEHAIRQKPVVSVRSLEFLGMQAAYVRYEPMRGVDQRCR